MWTTRLPLIATVRRHAPDVPGASETVAAAAAARLCEQQAVETAEVAHVPPKCPRLVQQLEPDSMQSGRVPAHTSTQWLVPPGESVMLPGLANSLLPELLPESRRCRD